MAKFGTWAEIPTPYTTHIISKAGMDFSIVDMEHGVIDFETAQNMVFAAHCENKELYIRVPAIEESWIVRTLDTGCDGIIFPQVSEINDVEKIIQFSYFSPIGNRGFNPYITAGCYGAPQKDFFLKENKRIKIGIILEGKQIFDELNKILQYEEIDIIYIGQYDLSVALGVPGDVTNPLVLEIMDNAIESIKKTNKLAGCMVHSVEEAKEIVKQGFSFIVYKVDSGLLFHAINTFIKEVNKK